MSLKRGQRTCRLKNIDSLHGGGGATPEPAVLRCSLIDWVSVVFIRSVSLPLGFCDIATLTTLSS
jgi:hypothetical protein